MTGGGPAQNTVPAIPIYFWAARSEVGQRMTTTLYIWWWQAFIDGWQQFTAHESNSSPPWDERVSPGKFSKVKWIAELSSLSKARQIRKGEERGKRMRVVAQEQTWNTSKWKGEEEINFKLKDVFHWKRNEFADTKLQFGIERPCNMISSAICEFSAVNKSTRECATKHSTHHSHSHTCYTVIIIIWSWV